MMSSIDINTDLIGQLLDRMEAKINPTYDGLTPEAAPVLQPPHAATRLIAHNTFGTDWQVAFQPLVRHGHLGKIWKQK